MNALHLVPLADRPPQPWRNGGGTTRELLAWPQAGDWQLRVSVAEIARDGAFSSFAGVQRWFAVLEGAGVRLALPAGAVTLTARDEPVAFEGEAAPMCTLLAGTTQDLNLMARRDAGRARLRRAAVGSKAPGGQRWRALYAAGAATLGLADLVQALPPGTLAWSDDGAAAPWTLLGGAHAFWLTLEAA